MRLASRQKDFEALGIRLVAVSYDEVAVLQRFAAASKGRLAYPLLADPDSTMIRAFGVLNTDYGPDHRWHGVPYPVLLLVTPEGRVVLKWAEARYQQRPEVEEVLAAIRAWQAKTSPGTNIETSPAEDPDAIMDPKKPK